jgi:hypothetical protein
MIEQERTALWAAINDLRDTVAEMAEQCSSERYDLRRADERHERRLAFEAGQRKADYREIERRLKQIENDL